MAKSNNQKAKILFLEQMLRETGENRIISMQEILDRLSENGITAERKSVYDDMEALRVFGMDVRFRRGRPGGYYLAGQRETDYPNTNTKADDESETPVVSFVHEAGSADKKMKLVALAEREEEVKNFFKDTAEYVTREDGTILVTTAMLSDPQFFGWLTAMGGSVKILKPKKAGQIYREYLKNLAREYKGI